ncbi:MAG: hypothetical protein JXQ73_24820 [Phycisphaerae bacterium]|nr:hypothetical protein [Phycisphaerae bacterium]
MQERIAAKGFINASRLGAVLAVLLMTVVRAGDVPAGGYGKLEFKNRGTPDEIKLVRVGGTRYEMGFWYGRLLADDIAGCWGSVSSDPEVAAAINQGWLDYAIALMWNSAYFDTAAYEQELQGIADGCTAGGHPEITLHVLKMIIVFPDVDESMNCSLFIGWGGATAGDRLCQLRNLDWNMNLGVQDHPVVVIYEPVDGNVHAVIGFAGMIGVVGGGINEHGLAQSEIMGWFGDDEAPLGVPFPVLLRESLYHDSTMDQALARIQNATRSCEYYYGVSGPEGSGFEGRLLLTSMERCDIYADNESVDPHPGFTTTPFHGAFNDVVYWNRHDGKYNQTFYNAIDARYGSIDAAKTIELAQTMGVSSTVLSVVYDVTPTQKKFWAAYAEGPNVPAYQRPYVGFELTTPATPMTALDSYVAMEDTSYNAAFSTMFNISSSRAYVLDMVSQNWRTLDEVNHTDWHHWVTVIKPNTVSGHRKALLVINGGSYDPNNPLGSRPSASDGKLAEMAAIAEATNSVVVNVSIVPNQRLKFADEADPNSSGRSEDELVAYTWDKYLRTGEPTWLARLPMTKAAVRAMDAATAWLTNDTQFPGAAKTYIDGFVVTGASKRGWTAWTTAAVDSRVIGVIPVVIDVLNVEPSMRHHYAALGYWAPAIGDYEDMGIMGWVGTPEFDAMMDIIDPYRYRDRYASIPKYMINAGGDDFFLPDSWQFYYDDLPGEKYLRYVPNADHGLDGYIPPSLAAYYQAIITGSPRPGFSWTFEPDGSIRVETDPNFSAPSSVVFRQATNPDARDFRKSPYNHEQTGWAWDPNHLKWEESPLSDQGGGVYVAQVDEPNEGWRLAFVELTYPGTGTYPFVFTTGTRVLPEAATLTVRVNDEALGEVIGFNPKLPRYYRPGTAVTLTAQPTGAAAFDRWRVYDPNFPGDANFAYEDTNSPFTVVMAGDREVEAVFGGDLKVTIQPMPALVAPGETAVLTASASGGAGPYTYAWATGHTGATLAVAPTITTTYRVTATDRDGRTAQATTTIKVMVGATALDKYVATPDPVYTYSLVSEKSAPNPDNPGEIIGTVYTIRMTSQKWRDATEVDYPVWKHWLVVVVPTVRLASGKGFLWVSGSNRSETPPDFGSDSEFDEAFKVAAATRSVVAVLLDVPNQPLRFIQDDPDPNDPNAFRGEDRIIARSYKKFGDEYEATGGTNVHTTWPALLPMVKSTVRAMDTVQNFLGQRGVTVQNFIVSGGSKRGWTTWLTAAVDQPRVCAIMPAVIDLLNMDRSMDHHYAAFGGDYQPAVGDYVREEVMQKLNTTMGQALVKIVDPFEYRSRFTSLPKFIINATGDEFFMPDSAQFYYRDLPGTNTKWLRYVPNTNHGLGLGEGSDEAVVSLQSFLLSVLLNLPRPQFTWTLEGDNAIRVQVGSWSQGYTARLWQAHVEEDPNYPGRRDFRKYQPGIAGSAVVWTDTILTPQSPGVYVGQVDVPETGWTGFYVELEFENTVTIPYVGVFDVPYKFSTEIRVIPEIDPYVTLDVQVSNGAWAHVDADPTPHVGAQDYRIDSDVALTAVLDEPNTHFIQWQLFDPNQPGDANYATTDANQATVVSMARADRQVKAVVAGQLTVKASADPNVSVAGNSVTLRATPTNGWGNKTYVWNTVPEQLGQEIQIAPTDPGDHTYAVTVTDDFYTATSSVVVKVPTATTATVAANPTVIPSGASSVLTASGAGGYGAYAYAWSTGANTKIVSVSPSQPGDYDYTVTVTDTLGQSDQATATVTVATAVTVEANADAQKVARGQSTFLRATAGGGHGGYTYRWSNGQFGSEIEVTPTKSTKYTVVATDGLGQTASAFVEIAVAQVVDATVTATKEMIPDGGSSTLTAGAAGGVAPYTYNWSDGQRGSSVTVSPIETTVYTVTVTDSLGQLADASVTVGVAGPIKVVATAEKSTIVPGQECILTGRGSGGLPPFTYAWRDLQTGATMSGITVKVKPDQTTTYQVTGTDTLGQTAEAQVTVSVAGVISVIAVATPSIVVAGESCGLSAIASGGQGPYQYLWSEGSTGQSITVMPGRTTTYSVTATDTLGQSAKGSVQIVVQERYRLTVQVQGQGAVDNLGGLFDKGAKVTLRATPSDNWLFGFWGGELSDSEDPMANPLTVTMDSAKEIAVVFIPESQKENPDTGQPTPNDIVPVPACGAFVGTGQLVGFWLACGLGLIGISLTRRRR